MPFSYIGQAKTGQQFIDYVGSYDFGSVPPSFMVIHHTYNPDASWAPISTNQASWWNRNESGLNNDQIKAKRKPQLDSIKNYYVGKGWTTGPHLFIDEKWIWLFTPMYDVGTHAASGNSYHDASGLHYSIGIETVGYFEYYGWPESMQKLLQIAVQSLQARLGNFDIIYMHAPTNTPQAHDHQISFHRDYNKPECPGGVITAEYAIPILSKPYGSLYTRYMVTSPCAVSTARAPDGGLAGGPDGDGQTWLAAGDVINVGDVQAGWLWVSPNEIEPPGIGFIPSDYARAL